jgi:hypothetical protein
MQSQPSLKANQTEIVKSELEPPTYPPPPTKTTQENINNQLESSPLIGSLPFIITTKLVDSKVTTSTINNHNLIKIEAEFEGDINLNQENNDNNLPIVQEEEDFNDDENIMLNRINNLNKNIEKYVDTVTCENNINNSLNKHEINQKDNNKGVKIVELIENNRNEKKKMDEEEVEIESANDSSSTVETSSGNTTSTNNSSSATTNEDEEDDEENKSASSNNKTDSFNSTNSELEQS